MLFTTYTFIMLGLHYRHPFFWSKKKQVQFMAAVGRQPEIRSGYEIIDEFTGIIVDYTKPTYCVISLTVHLMVTERVLTICSSLQGYLKPIANLEELLATT